MLTISERSILAGLGIEILNDTAKVGASTLMYGIFTIVFSISVARILSSRNAKTLSLRLLFGASAASFMLASLNWATYVFGSVKLIHGFLIGLPGRPFGSSRLDAMDEYLFRLNLVVFWSRQIIQILADGVVVWRAWVLCREFRLIMMLPYALLLGTCATSFAFLGLTFTADGMDNYSNGGKMRGGLYNAQGALSLTTNIVSTAIIGYRLWCFRQDWKLAMGGWSTWSRAQSVLLIITESGVIYAVYQLATIVTLSLMVVYDTPLNYFVVVIYQSYVQTTAMYSTIVFLLVSSMLSMENLHSALSINATYNQKQLDIAS